MKKQMNIPEIRAPKVLLFDIEASALTATLGTIFCIGWKWLGEKQVHTLNITDFPHRDMLDDRRICKEFAKIWDEADYVSGWYSSRYDQPMIQSKLVQYGFAPLSPKPHLDLWRTAKYVFKIHSNRLAAWQEFLNLPDAKTPLKLETWRKAVIGNKSALRYIRVHCEQDVKVLEQAFVKMRPFIKGIPHQNVLGDGEGCTACGSMRYQARGTQMTIGGLFRRFQCQDCGRWFKGKKALKRSQWAAS